jgi:hypothetical protein
MRTSITERQFPGKIREQPPRRFCSQHAIYLAHGYLSLRQPQG